MSTRGRPKKKRVPPWHEMPRDLNQVVAYNLRAARERRGWTQAHLAELLEGALGSRVTASTVSSLERTWDGDRRRQFNVHEVAVYAQVLDMPFLWFLLPPPGYRGQLEGMDLHMHELYVLILGRNDQIGPLLERLRSFGVIDPTPEDEVLENIHRTPSHNRQMSFSERRKELLMAVLDERAGALDRAAEELGSFFDHLRQVGIRGFIAEHTNDVDYAILPEHRGRPDEVATDGSTADTRAEAAPDGPNAERGMSEERDIGADASDATLIP